MPEAEILKFMMWTNADYYQRLINAPGQGAEKPVPKRKQHSIIGISFFYLYRMVHAVHRGGDKKPNPEFFKKRIYPDAAVMKLYGEVNQYFEEHVRNKRNTQCIDNHHAHKTGHKKFADMKTAGSRYIQIHIRVMDPVETPEKRDNMVEQMPDIENKIKYQDPENHFQPVRHREWV